jgi:antitoxin PrlF
MPTYTSTMTSKGQVTIPKELRDELGLKPSDRVVFTSSGNGLITIIPKTRKASELYGFLADKPRTRKEPISIEEMDEIISKARLKHGMRGLED